MFTGILDRLCGSAVHRLLYRNSCLSKRIAMSRYETGNNTIEVVHDSPRVDRIAVRTLRVGVLIDVSKHVTELMGGYITIISDKPVEHIRSTRPIVNGHRVVCTTRDPLHLKGKLAGVRAIRSPRRTFFDAAGEAVAPLLLDALLPAILGSIQIGFGHVGVLHQFDLDDNVRSFLAVS